jgi:hypothetical protein
VIRPLIQALASLLRAIVLVALGVASLVAGVVCLMLALIAIPLDVLIFLLTMGRSRFEDVRWLWRTGESLMFPGRDQVR